MDNEKDITLEDLREGYFADSDEENETGYAPNEVIPAEESSEAAQVNVQENESPIPSADADAENIGAASGNVTSNGDIMRRYSDSMEHMQGIEQLREENEALKAALAKANASESLQAKDVNAAVADTLTGNDMPSFDDESYSFASDAERKQMMTEYTRALVDYAVNKAQTDMLSRVAPLLDEHDKALESVAFDGALKELCSSSEFSDIDAYGDDVRRLCERDEFKGMKPYQRVTLAALVARGMHNSPAGEEKDLGKKADEILENEALMRELETRKAMRLHNSRADYPAQKATGSLSTAAFEPPKKAQSIEELRGLYGAI